MAWFGEMSKLRVIVVGTTCSGKTTLARYISESYGIPHIELDALFWQPNWTPPPREEFLQCVKDAVAGDEWVLDGNYSYTRDTTWPKATHLIWLNLPFFVVLWRSVRRTFGRMISKEEMWAGNRESFRNAFSRQSIIWWMISTYGRRQKRYRNIIDNNHYPHLKVLEIRSAQDVNTVEMDFFIDARPLDPEAIN